MAQQFRREQLFAGEEMPYLPLLGEDGRLNDALPAIFSADQKRYEAFLDPKTLQERIHAAPDGILRSAFRTKDAGGMYSWKAHRLLLVPNTRTPQILYGIRAMEIEGARQELSLLLGDPYRALTGTTPEPEGQQSGGSLWEDLMLHIPLPIFWKDQRRRFLGASQSFLDYYGLASIREILGKTDDDIRWHPYDAPYREDETEVIQTGKIHVNVPGRCIARGTTHTILATKWPVYRDGTVCGLMGYFLDEQMVAKLTNTERAVTGIDPVTGLENVSQFLDDLTNYARDYRNDHRTYGILFLRVPEVSRIAGRYGDAVGNGVLRAVAEAMEEEAGNTGACARIGSDQFAVLAKYQAKSEIKELAAAMRRRIEDIRETDGRSVTLFARIRIVYKTQTLNFEEALISTLLTQGTPDAPEK